MSEFGSGDPAPKQDDPKVDDPAPVTPELPDDIKKKIEHQDAFIEKLKKEAEERDAKLIAVLEKQAGQAEASQSKEDLVAMIEELKTAKPEPQEPSPAKEISIDEIVGAVGDQLKQEALEAKQASNLESSVALAKEAYGDDFDSKIVELAASKSMSLDSVNEMARNNPQVWKELFLPKQAPKTPDLGSTINGGGLDPKLTPEKRSITKMNSKDRGAYVQQLMKAHTLNN